MSEMNLFSSMSVRVADYVMKKKNVGLIRFDIGTDLLGSTVVKVKHVTNEKLLPVNFSITEAGLLSWLEERFVPKNRAFVERLLDSIMDPGKPILFSLLKLTLGLSLTDDYWVVPYGETLLWEDYNLYNNQFEESLARLAFTGNGNEKVSGITSSPEFTTDGMLRKCWRRIDGQVYLYKGGTTGYANAGLEPYSEYYATQIAEALEVNSVKYNLEKWKGVLCSTCKLFTSEKYSLVHAYTVYGDATPSHILENALDRTREGLIDMYIFDTIIVNCDRHFKNFGFLRDNDSGVLLGLAPLYDHGISLLNYAMSDDLKNVYKYLERKEMTFANVNASFAGMVSQFLTPRHRHGLRRLLNFEFKKHPLYNLPDDRLRFLNKFIQERAREALD